MPASADVDVALYDAFSAPLGEALDRVSVLEQTHAKHLLVYAWNVDHSLVEAWVAAGADGFVSKTSSAEVVALICQGLSNEDVARRSYLSINTVKSYIRSAYRKIGVSSRSQAVLWVWGTDCTGRSRPGRTTTRSSRRPTGRTNARPRTTR